MNVPTFDQTDFSFGPGIIFLGPYTGVSGTTPSTDVGAISEDGIAFEVTAEKKVISQGNPKMPIYAFTQSQGLLVKFTGIEWEFTKLSRALGAGVATTTASAETFEFGGDPIVSSVCLWVQHQMAVTGHTLNAYVWKAQAEAGMNFSLGQDEHSFPMSYRAMRVTTDWGSKVLSSTKQLFSLVRQIS